MSAMSAKPIQTTVPKDVADEIERMSREQLIPKSAVVRQLLVRRIREEQNKCVSEEVPV
jgi:hypothetical protein